MNEELMSQIVGIVFISLVMIGIIVVFVTYAIKDMIKTNDYRRAKMEYYQIVGEYYNNELNDQLSRYHNEK